MNTIDLQLFDVEFPEAKKDAITIYEYCFNGKESLDLSSWDQLSYLTLYNVGLMIDFAMPKQVQQLLPFDYVDEYLANTRDILEPYANLALLLVAPSYNLLFKAQYSLTSDAFRTAREAIPDFNLKDHKLEMMQLVPQSYLDILNMKPKYRLLIYRGSPLIPKNEYARPYTYNMVPQLKMFVDNNLLIGRLKTHTGFLSNFIGSFKYPTGVAYSMICGGFVLGCADDDLYQNIRDSDIDIFITGEPLARERHIRLIMNFLEELDYRFSVIGAVITCVNPELTTFLIQLINNNFDNPISVLDYFDTTHVLMMYDGENVVCTSKWYRYSPVGFTLLLLSKLKTPRLFKSIDKGFVPAINELNQVGVYLSGLKAPSVYYKPEYVINVATNKLIPREPVTIPRTFHRAADITIHSTFLDNDTYANRTSINYSHILDVPSTYLGKVYCEGRAYGSYMADAYILVIRDVLVPIPTTMLDSIPRDQDTILDMARLNHIIMSAVAIDKKLGNLNNGYYQFYDIGLQDLIPNDQIREEYLILKIQYQLLRTRESYERIERFVILNQNKIQTSKTATIDMLLNFIKYNIKVRANHEGKTRVGMDKDFNWYLYDIHVSVKYKKNAYYEGSKIYPIKLATSGIIFMNQTQYGLYAYKTWDTKPSFKYEG